MIDLVTWLRAQIDEDERLATKVQDYGRGVWAYDSGEYGPRVFTEKDRSSFSSWDRDINSGVWMCDDPDDECWELRAVWQAEGIHIARHDPARVLAEVEAKRRILDAYDEAARFYNDPTNRHLPAGEAHGLRTAVQLLALPYADREGYRDEWRPS